MSKVVLPSFHYQRLCSRPVVSTGIWLATRKVEGGVQPVFYGSERSVVFASSLMKS